MKKQKREAIIIDIALSFFIVVKTILQNLIRGTKAEECFLQLFWYAMFGANLCLPEDILRFLKGF